jgi:outer membrane lipoprotein-sorting protein
LFLVPEYKLTIMRAKPGSHEKTPLRVITFHRDDLMPYEQDVYDEHGNVETQITYSSYTDFGDNHYPSTVKIKRPQEDFEILLTVEKVTVNQPLTDDQFQIRIPEGTAIKNLE